MAILKAFIPLQECKDTTFYTPLSSVLGFFLFFFRKKLAVKNLYQTQKIYKVQYVNFSET